MVFPAAAIGAANAAERFTEAKILQVECHDNHITIFLASVSGDQTPEGNGYTNEPGNKPWLYLANSPTDIANRRHFLASALSAQAMGATVRFRWEDAGSNINRVIAMLQR